MSFFFNDTATTEIYTLSLHDALPISIRENNEILGLDDYQKDSENISEIIKTRMDSIPEFDMEIKELENKIILILNIYQGKNTPYFVVDGGSRTAYKRVGNQSVPATRIDLFNNFNGKILVIIEKLIMKK